MEFDRITTSPDVMGGAPCIRGLRVPVATVVGMVADGTTTAEILADYPYLEAQDVSQALHYAAEAVRAKVAEGLAAIDAGDVHPGDEVFDDLLP